MPRKSTFPKDKQLATTIRKLERKKRQSEASIKANKERRQRRKNAGLSTKEVPATNAMKEFFNEFELMLKNADQAYRDAIEKEPALTEPLFMQKWVDHLVKQMGIDATFRALTERVREKAGAPFFAEKTAPLLRKRRQERLDRLADSIGGPSV